MNQQILSIKANQKRVKNRIETLDRIIKQKQNVLAISQSKVRRFWNSAKLTNPSQNYHHHVHGVRQRKKRRLLKNMIQKIYSLVVSSIKYILFGSSSLKKPKHHHHHHNQITTLPRKNTHPINRKFLHRMRTDQNTVLSIYKILSKQKSKQKKRQKLLDRYQALFSTAWHLAILGFIFYFYVYYLRQKIVAGHHSVINVFDQKVVGVSQKALIESVLQSAQLNQKVAESLITLVNQPKIKKLMTELMIKLLRNPQFNADTKKLVNKIVEEYLRSSDCFEKTSKLIINQVLRNETVLQKIFELSKEYVEGSDNQMLKEKMQKILVDVIEIPEVSEFVCQRISNEVGKAFEQEKIQNLAIKILLDNLTKK